MTRRWPYWLTCAEKARRWRRREKLAGTGEIVATAATGKQAVMTDAVELAGEHM